MGFQGRRRFPLCKSVSTFVQPPSRCCSPSQCCCPDCPRAGPLAHGQQARRRCDGNRIAPSWVRVPCQSPGGESCPVAFAPSSTALVGFGLCRPSPGAAPAWGPLPFDLWEPSVRGLGLPFPDCEEAEQGFLCGSAVRRPLGGACPSATTLSLPCVSFRYPCCAHVTHVDKSANFYLFFLMAWVHFTGFSEFVLLFFKRYLFMCKNCYSFLL